MKYILPIIFAFQSSYAQIGTSAGYQLPMQFSSSRIGAVLKALTDYSSGFMMSQITNISLGDGGSIQVTITNYDKSCAELTYSTMLSRDETFKASLETHFVVPCGK